MDIVPELKMYFEHVDKRFDTLAEGMGAVQEKLNATFEAVGELKEDMVDVKMELGLIRNELKAKADRSELRLLEERVLRLERRAAAV